MRYWLTEFAAPCAGCDTGAPNPGAWSSASEAVGQAFAYLDAGASGALLYDAWDGFYEHHDSMGYWGLLAYDAATGAYTPRKSYYALEQLTRYVAPGAHRIAAETSDRSPVDVEAFADGPTGRLTVVMRNTGSGPSGSRGRCWDRARSAPSRRATPTPRRTSSPARTSPSTPRAASPSTSPPTACRR